MKWLCAADSYPRTFTSKSFYATNSSRRQETLNADQRTEPPHPFGLYSVTRVNPLYVDDSSGTVKSESKFLFQNSNDCDLKKTEYLHLTPLREDAVTVLKRDPDFVRSILVSVRLQGYHKRNGLTPIPEGKLDSIPRPIWPQDSDLRELRYDDFRNPKSPPRHKYKRWKYEKSNEERSMAPRTQKSLPEILRELSVNINNAMANADCMEIPPETVLQSLRDKINKCLDVTSPIGEDVSEQSLKDSAIATLSRAFSFVNSFNDGSQEDIEKGRLLLLKRLGKFLPSEPCYEHVQRSSSSSSSGASTSGFSDLTHTPTSSNSSASDSPTASRSADAADGSTPTAQGCENGLVAYDGGKSAFRTGCENANVKRAVSFSSFQCRVNQNQTTNSTNGTQGESVFDTTAKEADRLAGQELYAKSDTLLSSYPGHRCPDFTLDVQQAEKVMKKIQERKRERCWCRVITSFFGFAFLLFSVMFFSMMLTRGEKMFGSL